jgi:hypothetical protein
MIAGLIEQSPLARMAEPDDIADVALFLESDDSALEVRGRQNGAGLKAALALRLGPQNRGSCPGLKCRTI